MARRQGCGGVQPWAGSKRMVSRRAWGGDRAAQVPGTARGGSSAAAIEGTAVAVAVLGARVVGDLEHPVPVKVVLFW